MSKKTVLLIVAVLLAWSYYARPIYDYGLVAFKRGRDMAVEKIEPPYASRTYDDLVALNTQIVDETDAYLRTKRGQAGLLPELAKLDYSSPAAFQASADPLRAALGKALGYPMSDAIHGSDFSGVQSKVIGEDDLATYTLLEIPALPGVNVIGTLIEPKKHEARMPLIIANHGRGGMPPMPPDGKMPLMLHNDRDLAQGAIERGWAVFEPIFLFWAKGYPNNTRDLLTAHALEVGTTIPAIEITKLSRAIDYLNTRPEIDPGHLAMVGVSYGGFYTLYTTALEPRIQVAVVTAYFNDRAAVLDSTEPYSFFDWRFPNSLTLFTDPHLVALVCPRPLQIQSGTEDQLFPIEGSRRTIPEAAEYYRKLHLESNFDFEEMTERHNFNGEPAWAFIEKAWQAKK